MKFILEFLNKSNFFPYYIITPLPYAIGTAAQDILFGINKANQKKKKLIIIVPTIFQKYLNYSICNKHLFAGLIIDGFDQDKLFIKKLLIPFVNISFLINRMISLFIRKFTHFNISDHFSFLSIGLQESWEDETKINEKSEKEIKKIDFFFKNNLISLDKKIEEKSENILRKIGCEKNQDFVCLHVREGVYRNDRERRPFRNSSIENHYELINFLLKKRIFVIRIGRSSEQRIKFHHKYLFDIPFSDEKYDFFDLYLIKNCKFFIGDQSGPTDTAIFFKKDCLQTNMLRLFELPPTTEKSRTMFKLPILKKNKKILRLREYLAMPYFYHHSRFIDEELDYIENSTEDLFDAIKEYWGLIYDTNENFKKLEKIQLDVNQLIYQRYSEMYFGNDPDLKKFYKKKLLFKWLKSTRGSYVSSFIKKYF